MNIAICFGQFGPYHHARVCALQRLLRLPSTAATIGADMRCIPVQIAASTSTYDWKTIPEHTPESVTTDGFCEGLRTLCEGEVEKVSPMDVFLKARAMFLDEEIEIALLPSYSPAANFALFAAAKALRIPAVMMNESFDPIKQAMGLKMLIKRLVKRQIIKRFDAALVGGAPHKRHFCSLGMPPEKVFTGYDAIDNNLFAAYSQKLQSKASELGGKVELRRAYGLPARYFLSLGRMVEKKNLTALVKAYACFCSKKQIGKGITEDSVALLFVGSGELERSLQMQARELGLEVIEKREPLEMNETHLSAGLTGQQGFEGSFLGKVFFYGFRQIRENCIFYSLADAFVLPSLNEEWGLVVNEAMACSLPVLVSRAAGCVEDLLEGSALGCRAVQECTNGYVFDPTSVQALTRALELSAESKQRRLKMGKRSREIVENFSCDNFARQALKAMDAAEL